MTHFFNAPKGIDTRATVRVETDDNVWLFTCKKWGPEIRVYRIEGAIHDEEAINEAFRQLAAMYGAERVVYRPA